METIQQAGTLTGRQYLKNFLLSTGSYASFVQQLLIWASEPVSKMVCVANVHMFGEAQQDKSFLNLVNNAHMVTPDGKPLCWALKLVHGINQDRVAGMDLLPDLLAELEKKKMSVYFYGGSQKMLDGAEQYIQQKHPQLKIAGVYSPPFRALTQEENREVTEKINAAQPNVVFVILGCPKQERWMATVGKNVHALQIGVGGALPVMTGMQKRAPVWMQQAGLEWFYRLVQEPRRLFKRYAVTNTLFLWEIGKELIRPTNHTPNP